jgi:hypothetical protein
MRFIFYIIPLYYIVLSVVMAFYNSLYFYL